MKKEQVYLLVVLTICFVTKNFSQNGKYDVVNGIGIYGGLTKVNLITDNFETTQGDGYVGGMSATVDINHKWYNMSYGLQFSESTISILGRPNAVSTATEFIDYKFFAAQLALMMHVKLAESYLTLDAGPMLQYNGILEFKNDAQENYVINNYDNLSATDITGISQFNFNGAVGFTAGLKFLKLRAHYIYGFTNTLKKLESKSLDTSGGNPRFKGNLSMFLFGAMISF